MIVTGFASYSGCAGKEIEIHIDTMNKADFSNKQIDDAISFALFGKTVFHSIIDSHNGVPLITLSITCREKTIHIARQPEYLRETHFGSKYICEEKFSIKTETQDYPSLSSEMYYQILNDFIDMSYDEFASLCHSSAQ